MTALPLPPVVWQRIVVWLAPERWGEITLIVKRGQVVGCTITETIKVEDCQVDRMDAHPVK